MNVSVVVPYSGKTGGAFHYTNKLISSLLLSEKIDNVIIITTINNVEKFYKPYFESEKIQYIAYKNNSPILNKLFKYFGYVKKINYSALQAVKKSECNLVIYTAPWNEGFYVQEKKKICVVHDLFHYKNDDFDSFLLKQSERGKKTLEMLCLADMVVCESEDTKALVEKLLNEFGIVEKPIKIINLPPGFSPSDDKGGTSVNVDFCDYWLIPSHIFPFKNQMIVVRALDYLRENYGHTEKVVFTFPTFSPVYFIKIIYRAIVAGVIKQIVFRYKASDDEMVRLYKKCKGVIIPTRIGPTNMPAIEAIEFGKNFIAADGSTDLWRHGIKYGQFPPDDHIALAKLMLDTKHQVSFEIHDLPSSRFKERWINILGSFY